MCARLKARANRAKSGSVNFSRPLSRRTATRKYRSEGKGPRSFDSAIEYGTATEMAREKTRTAKPAVRGYLLCGVALAGDRKASLCVSRAYEQ